MKSTEPTIPARLGIFRGIGILTGFSVVQKILSVFQQFLIIRFLGSTAQADGFFIAQTGPLLVGTLVGVSLTTSFVTQITNRDATKASELWGAALIATLILVGTSCFLLGMPGPFIEILGHGLEPRGQVYAEQMLRCMAFLFAFLGVSGIANAFYFSHGRFLVPSIASQLLYIGGIAGVFVARFYGPYAIALGLTAGGFLQLVALLICADPMWRVKPRYDRATAQRLAIVFTPIILINAVTVLYLIIDRSYITGWPTGYVAAITIAGNLMTIPVQIIVNTATTALLPALSRLRESGSDLSPALRDSISYIVLVLTPTVMILCLGARPMILLLFRSASFGAEQVHFAAASLAIYGMSMIGIAMKDVFTTALIALNQARAAVLTGVASLMISLALKLLVPTSLGPLSVAYTTGVATLFAGLSLAYIASRFLPRQWYTPLLPIIMKAFAAAVIATATYNISTKVVPKRGLIVEIPSLMSAAALYGMFCVFFGLLDFSMFTHCLGARRPHLSTVK